MLQVNHLTWNMLEEQKGNKFSGFTDTPEDLLLSMSSVGMEGMEATDVSLFSNWASVFVALALIYYLTLSIPMFVGFLVVGGGFVFLNHYLSSVVGDNLLFLSIGIFIISWLGQFIGHKIEGKKPSFFKDLQFLLIGPAWLLSFIFTKIGLKY